MKAIILAGGKGIRSGSYGRELPKCLFDFQGRTILEHQLDALTKNGIYDIVLVTGYKSEMIKKAMSHYSNFSSLRVKYIHCADYETTKPSYGWWLAREHVRGVDKLLHLNSDLVFFDDLIKKVVESEHDNVVCIDKETKLNKSMEQVILAHDGRMMYMDQAEVDGADGKGVGVAKLSRDAVNFILRQLDELVINKKDKSQNFYKTIRMALKHIDFYGLDIGECFFREINTAEDYEIGREKYKKFWEGTKNFDDMERKSLIFLYGPPATGKTTASRKIRDRFETETNVELVSTFKIREDLGLTDLYSKEQREKVYLELSERLEKILKEGRTKCVILDGNFNKKNRREKNYLLAKKYGADVYIVECQDISPEELGKRLAERRKHANVLEHKASTPDLYHMIKNSTEIIDIDLAEREDLLVVSNDTQEGSVSVRPGQAIDAHKEKVLRIILESLRQ
jgi:L-glutamine-phosphate cytidylyltransferase